MTLMDAYEPVLQRLEKTAKMYTNIARENGIFLSILVKGINATRALEIGTSNGYSAIWLAAALKTTGGKLVTVEADSERAKLARDNLREGGLESFVEIRVGNALEEIPHCEGDFDFVFLDGEKHEYLRYLKLALPKLRTGGLVVADDTRTLRHQMRDYVDFVFNTPSLQSVDLPLDDGVILSYKTRNG